MTCFKASFTEMTTNIQIQVFTQFLPSCFTVKQEHSATGLDTSRGTRRPRRPAGRLARLGAAVIAQILPAHGTTARDTAIVDVRSVAVIPIDAGDDRGAVDKDVAERAVPRVLRAAVAARPVHLADRRRPEVLDRHRARAVVLEHLVLGVARPAAVDVGYPRRGGPLEGRCVFADVGPPAKWILVSERRTG